MQRPVLAAVAGLILFAMVAAPPAAAQTASQCTGGKLNDDCLETALTNLGYTPKKLSKGYLITASHGTWNLSVQLVLSGDGRKIGMNANLGVLNEGLTADNYKAILVKNGDIDPTTFYVDDVKNQLLLHRTIDNHDVTPAILREELDHFMDGLESSSSAWSNLTH